MANILDFTNETDLQSTDVLYLVRPGVDPDKNIIISDFLNFIKPVVSIDSIASANVIKTLPEISGLPQEISYFWTGGAGTYKLTLAVTDGATIGGLAAAIWEGEGEGSISLVSDGTNWQVKHYEDSGKDTDEGWRKDKSGVLEQWVILTSGASAVTWTYLLPFLSLANHRGDAQNDTGAVRSTQFSGRTVNDVDFVVLNSAGNPSTGLVTGLKAIGRWRT